MTRDSLRVCTSRELRIVFFSPEAFFSMHLHTLAVWARPCVILFDFFPQISLLRRMTIRFRYLLDDTNLQSNVGRLSQLTTYCQLLQS